MESREIICFNPHGLISNRKNRKIKPQDVYPVDIQFYDKIPPPITAEQLINIVTERIYVLKIINSVVRDIGYKKLEEKCRIATERLKNIGSNEYITLINSKGHRTCSEEDLKNRIIDHTSFVILSLALIADEQLYERFQKVEEAFFNIRLSNLDEEGMREVLKLYNKFPKVDDHEKRDLQHVLINFLDEPKDYDNTEIFKVPMSVILGFINPHEIYFNKGIAFIPFNQMKAVLRGLFRENLEQQVSSINMEYLKYCDRIFDQSKEFKKILEEVYKKFKQVQQYSLRDGTILASDIDELAVSSFPPCMRAIHEVLRAKHHLKHESRLQYTLFLKGIGVPVDETVKMFREEFLKKVSLEKFNKEYRYYIEHAYGFRGNKHDYDPQSCMEIQNTPTALNDCNGCLFSSRSMIDIEDLNLKLTQWNISDSYKEEIIERTTSGNCGYACAHYFEATNDCSLGQSVKHPNQYFKDSRYVRANGLTEYRCEYEQDNSDVEQYEDAYPTDILDDEAESNQLLQEKTSEAVVKINQPTPVDTNIESSSALALTSRKVSNVSTTVVQNIINKTASTSKLNIPKIPISISNHDSILSINNQILSKETIQFIRKGFDALDESIGMDNIRTGVIITFKPKCSSHKDDDSSDDCSPVRKRKKSR